MFPEEIAGLVFVNPVDFTQKKGDGDLPYLEIGLTQHQIDSLFGKSYDNFIEKLYEEMPGFYVEEVKVSRSLYNSEFKECDSNSLPSWLKFNAMTKTFSGEPKEVTELRILVTATDMGNDSGIAVYKLTVVDKP